MFVKQVQISNFKSFGGTVTIPLLPGFTAISGPNGSGKSNILDALLFCLGLSSSKGMRADRLPDLVNQAQMGKGKRSTVEASVTVTFDLSEEVARLSQSLPATETPAAASATSETLSPPTDPEDSTDPRPVATTESNPPDPGELEAAVMIEELPLGPEGEFVHEWSVTRRLRVTQQGTYTSNYAINGSPATLGEVHQELAKLRIYPEGYNVVLQGDVTGIISMNARERREIIDELAGVANFDRKIQQTRHTLDDVKEREDRCRILEQELQAQCDRLAKDRTKALKYQQLRQELHTQQGTLRWVAWRCDCARAEQLRQGLQAGQTRLDRLLAELGELATAIALGDEQLAALNQRVKDLGESEQLGLQGELARQSAALETLAERQASFQRAAEAAIAQRQDITDQMAAIDRDLADQSAAAPALQSRLAELRQARDRQTAELQARREAAASLASASAAGAQHQVALRQALETAQAAIDPQRAEQVRLAERVTATERSLVDLAAQQAAIATDLATQQAELAAIEEELSTLEPEGQAAAAALVATEQELQLQLQTRDRLLGEQRDKQRQLDKLEAQSQATRESQGTYAVQVIRQTGLDGICGLVAELGQVEPRYQLALEIAAGARLGQLVVEDDSVAAAAIALLKRANAGRITFLPLNKIRGQRPDEGNPALARGGRAAGWVDYAVHLVQFEARYQTIFQYVFGSTIVFESLDLARAYPGRARIVTLEGELLEASGAMTGGSLGQQRGGLHFGSEGSNPAESRAVRELRDRLSEIERILGRCEGAIAAAQVALQAKGPELAELRSRHREAQAQRDRLRTSLASAQQQHDRLAHQQQQLSAELVQQRDRLGELDRHLPTAEAELARLRQELAALETAQGHDEWQQAQTAIRQLETALDACQEEVRQAETAAQQQHDHRNRQLERRQQAADRLTDLDREAEQRATEQAQVAAALGAARDRVGELKAQIAELEKILGETKQARDRTEATLQAQRQKHQELDFKRQRLQESQASQRQDLQDLERHIATERANLLADSPLAAGGGGLPGANPAPEQPFGQELPPEETAILDPFTVDPSSLDLAALQADRDRLQADIASLQHRLEALEPVNMLALEEYDRVAERLQSLSEKLATIEEERTELLLRIENFTTLRQQAFQEAFTAVDRHFQAIFADLSQGDGHLQLDNAENPLEGGLTLVAHPKGKPVQRLASMSGGEKSLTALSFIFALQRYRPSTFYAFDEVDMFLDGANAERLAKMVKKQSKQAQFIVVSLRRPTIEASDRTIGVTQARGAHTQVLGIAL